jgi:hypothetical protein
MRLACIVSGIGPTRVALRNLLALAAILILLKAPAAAATLMGKADIVDGDTIKVGGLPVRPIWYRCP